MELGIVGLGRIGRLGIPGDDLIGVVDAIDFIQQLKTRRADLRNRQPDPVDP